jgi:hypothetical protein
MKMRSFFSIFNTNPAPRFIASAFIFFFDLVCDGAEDHDMVYYFFWGFAI